MFPLGNLCKAWGVSTEDIGGKTKNADESTIGQKPGMPHFSSSDGPVCMRHAQGTPQQNANPSGLEFGFFRTARIPHPVFTATTSFDHGFEIQTTKSSG